MKQDNEEYEDSLPDGAPGEKKPKKPEDTPGSRLDALEKNVDVMTKGMGKILKLLTDKNAQEEDEEEKKPEEKSKKKQDDPEKKPEDKKPEGEEEKNKTEGMGTKPVNPNPEGGDAPLPKAPAGETDESAKPEGDKGPKVVEKDIKKMVEIQVQEILKGMGVTKSVTPRSKHEEIVKQNSEKKNEFALDILKRAKDGKLTVADMNRETKEFVKKKYDEGLQNLLELEVGE